MICQTQLASANTKLNLRENQWASKPSMFPGVNSPTTWLRSAVGGAIPRINGLLSGQSCRAEEVSDLAL